MVDWNDTSGFMLRLLYQDSIHSRLWPIISCNGITRFAFAKWPIQPLPAVPANGLRNIAQTQCANGLPFFACYIGLFVRPVITTWYRVKDIYNIEVWTGFDDHSICLEPDNYVGTTSYCMDIFGTAVFYEESLYSFSDFTSEVEHGSLNQAFFLP